MIMKMKIQINKNKQYLTLFKINVEKLINNKKNR